MPLHIVRNDISKVKADAIVNSANPHPHYANGVDYAIYKAAGEAKLLAERKKIGEMLPGTAAVTPAFALPAQYIIHTVGPEWIDGKHGELETLRSCYETSLQLAYDLKCRSIAFPLISTGIYEFPKDQALQIALSVLQDAVLHHKIDILLVIFDTDSYELSGQVFSTIDAYVDDHYVQEASDVYYELKEESNSGKHYIQMLKERRKHQLPLQQEEDPTFQEKLLKYLDQKNIKDPEFYNDLHISRQMFSKIRSNPFYQPKKGTALAMCVRLHLNLEEAKDLLGRAGYAFSPVHKTDVIVKGFILNKEYSLVDIDLYLNKQNCPMLLKYE